MQDIKVKLTELIKSFLAEESEKTQLLQQLETEGVTSGILEATGEMLTKTIEQYETESLAEYKRIENEMENIKVEYQRELTDIFKQQREEEKAANQKKDAEQLESLRKRLQ